MFPIAVTKTYLKIFIGFWIINVLTFFGTDGVAYWFNLRPDYGLQEYRDNPYKRYAVRSLNETARFVIQFDLEYLRTTIPRIPDWIYERIFVIDPDGVELRGRETNAVMDEVLSHLSADTPFHILNLEDQTYAGQYIVLRDGQYIRVISFSTPASARKNFWLFYIRNNWDFFVLSMLISGVACFFLAMYLSKGIRTLQEGIREIGKGDLSVRIAPQLGNRRDEIGELGREFDDMTSRLEKSMLEQKRLIKDVSHELRSPLARLQFALGLAQQRSNGVVKNELEKVREAADYLGNIISTILAFPTNESESWELTDVVDIKAMLEGLSVDYQAEAAAKKITVQFHSDLEEALVATYGTTLTGVFENVINNAVHYTLNDTVVEIDLAVNKNTYVVAVRDHGLGVDEKELLNIFEPFYRTDEARDRASGGYGLGLSIAQRTVALHRGSIKAQNAPGGGLVVTVVLPKGDFD